MIDAVDGFIAWDREIADLVVAGPPVLAVWNKVDAVLTAQSKGRISSIQAMQDFRQLYPDWPTFAVSAISGQGIKELIAAVIELLPENPPYFPDDILTDDPEAWWSPN